MLNDMQAGRAWANPQDDSLEPKIPQGAKALPHEHAWRRLEPDVGADDISISRWTDARDTLRSAEATTPADRYFIGIALKTTRLKLSRERQTIFDGVMPAGTLYIGAPSKQLSAQFYAPCDFLHFHVSVGYFSSEPSARAQLETEGLNDLVLLRDSFAQQLARALTEQDNPADERFARCIGQTLAMHLGRLEFPRTKVNALPKWRLRRVEEYIRDHFERCISLADLAKVAGLSRMHFAAQFRAATGYRPREYLLHQRIEHAKSLLLSAEMPLAEIALAVGFCTQAHFSTVFKRITGETPARWRCASKNELQVNPPRKSVRGSSFERSCEIGNVMGSRNTLTPHSAILQM
jgi:AraC family transcriptional regulator